MYRDQPFSLVVPGALVEQNLVFPRRVVVYASANNPNAREVADEMVAQFAGLSVCDDSKSLQAVVRQKQPASTPPALPLKRSASVLSRSRSSPGDSEIEVAEPELAGAPPTPEPTHFLLYLNKRTFLEAAGEALAAEVRAALDAGLPIAMIHEKDEAHAERRGCAFDTFFKTVCAAARLNLRVLSPVKLSFFQLTQFCHADAARPARPRPVQGARHRVRGRPGATSREPHGLCRIDWRRQEHRCASDEDEAEQAEQILEHEEIVGAVRNGEHRLASAGALVGPFWALVKSGGGESAFVCLQHDGGCVGAAPQCTALGRKAHQVG